MIDLADVQAGIVRPIRAPRVEIAHLQATGAAAMVELVGRFADLVTTQADLVAHDGRVDPQVGVATTLGCTAAGLRLAGASDRALAALPPAFAAGMRAAARRLGDRGGSDPARWHPPYAPVPLGGRPDATAVPTLHAVVVRHGPAGAAFAALDLPEGVVEVADPWVGERRADRTEPFGFRDDISDPVVEGSGRPVTPGNGVWDDERGEWRAVRTGEALLGHVDESGAISGHADAAHLERNGSYLVLRRLEQDVAGFWATCERWADELTAATPDQPVSPQEVAAQMVGRHANGAPLGRAAEGPSNDFRYRDGGASGVAVPPSSHIRRTNPRDDMAFASSIVPRHQLFRRGYPYADETGEGLLFLACCADLARQFEFTQAHWIDDGDRFGLGSERDPLIGERSAPEAGAAAMASIDVAGQRVRRRLPTFVTTRGGEYLLLPSPSALRLLGGRAPRTAP